MAIGNKESKDTTVVFVVGMGVSVAAMTAIDEGVSCT